MHTLLLAFLALVPAAAAAAAPEPATADDTVSPANLARAIHADRALWLLYVGGEMRRLDDGAATLQRDVAAPPRVIDLCRHGRRALVAARDGEAIVFRHRQDTRWLSLGSAVRMGIGERTVGLACQGPQPLLVTDKRLVRTDGKSVALQGALPRALRYTLFAQGDDVLVGTNAGEWGGDLVRISVSTGVVTKVDGAGAPVQDIAAQPGKPDCVVVAVGLVHFFPSGRLSSVCGAAASRLYAAPYQVEPFGKPKPPKPGEDPYPGVAFFGLAPDGNRLVAIGVDGLRDVTASGIGPVRPLPAFKQRGGLGIAEVSPRLLLVLTGINGRASLSGAIPLAVPR